MLQLKQPYNQNWMWLVESLGNMARGTCTCVAAHLAIFPTGSTGHFQLSII